MKQCLARIKRRPLIIILMAVLTLPLCLFEQFNAVTERYGSFSKLFEEDFMTTLSNVADGIANSWSTPGIFLPSTTRCATGSSGRAIPM